VLLSLIALSSAICPTAQFVTCPITAVGDKAQCDCWANFKASTGAQDCSVAEALTVFIAAKGYCNSLFFDFDVVKDCGDAAAIQVGCIAQLPGTQEDACSCFNNYQTNAAKVCNTNNDLWSELLTCKSSCTESCCGILDKLISNNVTASFSTCFKGVDKCGCYKSTVSSVTSGWNVCTGAQNFQLQACVQTQLSCDSFDGTTNCQTIDVTLTIAQIKQLWEDYQAQYIAFWNRALTKLSEAVTVVQAETTTEDDTVTITIDFTCDAKYTTDQIEEMMQNIVSKSVGMRPDQFKSSVEFSSNKRQTTQSGKATLVGESDSTSDAFGLSVLLAPIITFISALYFYNKY